MGRILLLTIALVSAFAKSENPQDYFIFEEISESNGWKLKGQDICNPQAECYPLYFQPTTEFKYILPGQRIQKGLHVSMDYKTGAKMAKLMDPDEKDEYPMVPVEEKITVIHKPETLELDGKESNPSATFSKKDLTMEEKGSLKNLFLNEINSTDPIQMGMALDALADASHDLHVGIGIAFEKTYIDHLLSLLSEKQDYEMKDTIDIKMKDTIDILRSKSALVLVSVTSNNPQAIKLIQNHSPEFMEKLVRAFQSELDSDNPRKCKVCLKRIFQVMAMCSRTDIDAFRHFMNQNPFPILLKAVSKQTSLKDKIYQFLSAITGLLSPSDSIPFKDWCIQLQNDDEHDLLKQFSSLSPSCNIHIEGEL